VILFDVNKPINHKNV